MRFKLGPADSANPRDHWSVWTDDGVDITDQVRAVSFCADMGPGSAGPTVYLEVVAPAVEVLSRHVEVSVDQPLPRKPGKLRRAWRDLVDGVAGALR